MSWKQAVGTFSRALVCAVTPAIASAQPASGPHAIAGPASSGRYCLTGNGTNVHHLGWIEARSRYRITFDADVQLSSTVVRFDIATEQEITLRGDPDFNLTASISGMAVLLVSSNSRSGCYRYQVSIDPPSAQLAAFIPAALRPRSEARDRVEPSVRQPNLASGPRAIAGASSSGSHCVSGDGVPGVHELGRVDRAADISVAFEADFPSLSAVTMTKLDSNATRMVIEKTASASLSFAAQAGDNIVLYVTGRSGIAGCYRYSVAIR